MSEINRSQRIEANPQTPEQTLQSVGLTPEHLKGTKIVFFGNETNSLARKIEAKQFEEFDFELFLRTDEIIRGSDRVDYVISSNNPKLTGELDNPAKVDLLAASVRAVDESGEVRISIPESISGQYVEEDYVWALYDRDLDVEVTYVTEDLREYLVFKPQQKVITEQ